ncbi:hypothetical protein HYPSUDRAFT_529635 [Hypholoma sublateritium FD-334 SS-4]|uniref:Uncharacterized protein n=1 Tax=Hypholoma sublateritium (strain FD-334 SS-4) TaxID=945553 RepID=A0A0D2LB37_HYPSF|nr:hypothetical protein HYPSUDRAFT_529635 [Hypholoma sublateritium FD-334 SS-4]
MDAVSFRPQCMCSCHPSHVRLRTATQSFIPKSDLATSLGASSISHRSTPPRVRVQPMLPAVCIRRHGVAQLPTPYALAQAHALRFPRGISGWRDLVRRRALAPPMAPLWCHTVFRGLAPGHRPREVIAQNDMPMRPCGVARHSHIGLVFWALPQSPIRLVI